jgi:hypothetical protein
MNWIRIKLKDHEHELLSEALKLTLGLSPQVLEEYFAEPGQASERVRELASEARDLVERVPHRLNLRRCELDVSVKALRYARTHARSQADPMADQASSDASSGRNAARRKLASKLEKAMRGELLDTRSETRGSWPSRPRSFQEDSCEASDGSKLHGLEIALVGEAVIGTIKSMQNGECPISCEPDLLADLHTKIENAVRVGCMELDLDAEETSVAVELLDMQAERLTDVATAILHSPAVSSVHKLIADKQAQAKATSGLRDRLIQGGLPAGKDDGRV